ncbi:MAG: MmgE/PrpD family protein [Actinomycetota bacterium]|nr:MmgE/PrpD family protein [Actinomycetota bacterium]
MRPLDVVGDFAESLTWSAIPAATRERAQLALRDTLGTILGGATTSAGRVATATAQRAGGTTPIAGTTATSTPPLAAFASAVNASALDFDDGHYRGGAIHPASVIVPCLLVAAHDCDTDLHTFLTAQVVGYEIGLRAAHLLWPRHPLDDYHCTGTAATLGAAAAVAKLRGADGECIARAVAVAWAHAPMSTFQLPMVKESIGWSAATGLFAADLAAAGFMAVPHPAMSAIDATFAPTPFDRPGAMDDPFVATLGTVFEANNTYFKPYAACRYTHTAIRSLQDVMSENGLCAAGIEAVEVHTHRGAMNLSDQRPVSLDHGQYSFPFVLSAVMCTGDAGAIEISESALDDRARLTEAAKVTVHHGPEFDTNYPAHYGTRIVVRTIDGRRLERTRLVAPGDPADPMSVEDLTAKFIRLAEPVHGDAAVALAGHLIDPDVQGSLATVLLPTSTT